MKKIEDMEAHWTADSKSYKNVDPDGFALVCYAGMPTWFNKFADAFQKKTFRHLLSGVTLADVSVLDIGTGVGRWVGEFYPHTKSITGVDIEAHRLDIARKRFPEAHFLKQSIESLPFDDASFDFVNSITVLQHMPYPQKDLAIVEIGRVTKLGGHALIIELIDTSDDAKHVFPLALNDWTERFKAQGFEVIRIYGYES